jgi:hypothetical protein
MPVKRKETVIVRDKRWPITVYQDSEGIWIAAGEFMGMPLKVQDSSASTAAKHWREAALRRSKGSRP